MTRIFAIALISLRNAIRSKVVIVLLAALVLTLIGLPLTIKSDGTLEGQLRILMRYTLGLSSLILSLATIWAGCAAVASDIRDRHIQLVLTKPLRPIQLWLGKWLALCALNAMLLTLCVLSVFAAMWWQINDAEEVKTEILSAYRSIAPLPRHLDDAVQQRYQAGRARGEWPDEIDPETLQAHVYRLVKAQANAVPAEGRNQWSFRLPDDRTPDRPLLLRYRFSLSLMDLDLIHGRWSLITPAGKVVWSESVEAAARTWHQITLPSAAALEADIWVLVFENLHERPVTLLFDPDEGLALRVYAGSFAANVAQAATLLFFNLALLAAIGITAGSFFSMPVAALTSFYALLILHASRIVSRLAEHSHGHGHSHGPDPSAFQLGFEAVSHAVYAGIYFVIRPLYEVHPLERVTRAEWIGWPEVAQVFGWHVGLYCGALMLLGAWHLRRKEVALPT